MNGLRFGGSASVVLNPGVYVLTGNIHFGETGSVTGTNLTFFYASTSSYTDRGGRKMTLTGPLSGTYNEILMCEDRSNSSPIIMNAGGRSSFQGVIYPPAARLTMNSSSGTTLFTPLVVGSLTLESAAMFQDYSTINSSTPLTAGAVISQ